MSVCTTEGIKISVEARYLPDHSEPQHERFVFGYQITIENNGDEAAQLLSRHWLIKDALQNIEEVKGEGVVGEMPYLLPGEAFTYNSFCPLNTDYGFMRGTYTMQRPDGREFEAMIAPFVLLTTSLLN